MAAPHVSGVAALAYSVNPHLSGLQVKELITEQCSDYIVKAPGGKVYHCLNAEKVVKEALKTSGNTPVVGENTGVVLGSVHSAYDGEAIVGAQVCAYKYSSYDGNVGNGNLEDYQYITQTDDEGEFSLELDPGKYQVIIYESNYKPLVINNVKVREDKVEYLEKVLYLNSSGTTEAEFKGKLVDALNGSNVEGAEAIFRSGWNNYSGSIVKEQIFTDANGKYSISMPVGYYTIEFKKTGYINSYVNIIVCDKLKDIQRAVICPELDENEVRVVLTWGNAPQDLDSHLSLIADDKEYIHIYYANSLFYDSENEKIYLLDVDDTTQYGPETITFYTDNSNIDEYKYYVYNYSGGYAGDELSYSGARVTVYYGSQTSETFHVPINQMGRTWNVFSIVDGEIVIENTITP